MKQRLLWRGEYFSEFYPFRMKGSFWGSANLWMKSTLLTHYDLKDKFAFLALALFGVLHPCTLIYGRKTRFFSGSNIIISDCTYSLELCEIVMTQLDSMYCMYFSVYWVASIMVYLKHQLRCRENWKFQVKIIYSEPIIYQCDCAWNLFFFSFTKRNLINLRNWDIYTNTATAASVFK